jgi:cation diffusion facilitator family transporter
VKTKVHAISKLIVVSIISIIFLTIEIYGGIYTNSLSILSHSAFMLSEFLVYEISIIAVLMSDIKPSERLSFGYHRSEIIFSITSVLIIWTVTGILIVEGIHLIKDNVLYEIKSDWMLYFAIFGFVSNLIMVNILHIFGHNHKHIFEKEIYEEEIPSTTKKRSLRESLMPTEGASDNEVSEKTESLSKNNNNEFGK